MRGRRFFSPAPVIVAAVLLGSPLVLPAQKLTLTDVLAKAAEVTSAFADESRLLVCEEHYKQVFGRVRVLANMSTTLRNDSVDVETVPMDGREWVAEVAILATPFNQSVGLPWMEFRDILSVQGKPLRNGKSRLGLLAEHTIPVAANQAATVNLEAAEQVLGRIRRIIFVPRVAAIFLHPSVQSRFDFKKAGEKTLEGVKTWEVKYKEKAVPSIVPGSNGGWALSSGSFWIDPATGQVLMSVLKSPDSDNVYDTITVTCRRDPALGLWLPAEMKEKLIDDQAALRLDGTATFTSWHAVPRKGSSTACLTFLDAASRRR